MAMDVLRLELLRKAGSADNHQKKDMDRKILALHHVEMASWFKDSRNVTMATMLMEMGARASARLKRDSKW